jgi:hypothetical protein
MFSLLDGTNGNINAQIELNLSNGSGGSTNTSGNVIFGYMTARVGADMQAQDVFASGAWRKRIKTMYQVSGRLEGFVSQGTAISDPLSLVTGNADSAGGNPGAPGNNALPVTLTWQTGCTMTMLAQFFGDANEVRATANSGRGVDFESWGTVSTLWITS